MTATQTLTGDAPRERDAEARAVVATWTPEKLAQWRDLLRETQAHLCGLVDFLYDKKVSDLLCRLAELERLADDDILRRMGPLGLKIETRHYATCDTPGCRSEGPRTTDSPWRALALALQAGWRRLTPAEGDGVICRVCAAKGDLPALEADLLNGGPVLDKTVTGLIADMALPPNQYVGPPTATSEPQLGAEIPIRVARGAKPTSKVSEKMLADIRAKRRGT